MKNIVLYKNIEAERGRLGLSKTALADKLGITTRTYNYYIIGKPIPSTILLKLSKITSCSIDYLLESGEQGLIA